MDYFSPYFGCRYPTALPRPLSGTTRWHLHRHREPCAEWDNAGARILASRRIDTIGLLLEIGELDRDYWVRCHLFGAGEASHPTGTVLS